MFIQTSGLFLSIYICTYVFYNYAYIIQQFIFRPLLFYRTRVIPHVPTVRVKPVTELPTPSSNAIYDVQVFEPHKGTVPTFVHAQLMNKMLIM